MKASTTNEVLKILQEPLALAFKQWLDGNRPEILAAIKQGAAEASHFYSQSVRKRPTAKAKPHLTPSQLATRWGFHVESVRRIIRQQHWPVARIGRRIRIPLVFVEKYEWEATVRRSASEVLS